MFIKDLIYILQAELYNGRKFLDFSYSHFQWWRLENRSRLVWTKKAKLIYILTVTILLSSQLLFLALFNFRGFLILPILILATPLFIVLSLWVISPVDSFLKSRVIEKAKKVLRENGKNLTVIGITGSYGKTSTRDILFTILGEKFRVAKLGDNINTDLGIAEFIIKNPKLFSEKDIFIVEMGAYKKGEIKKICELVFPDYAILTGINEAHLERFGGLENTISAKFELPESAKIMSILNLDDENVRDNQGNFKIKEVIGVSKEEVGNVKLLDNFQGLEFSIDGVMFHTKLLAEHNISLILLASKVAEKLGMTLEEISRGVSKIEYVSHRLEPMYNEMTNVWVIDDSYNGNFNGIVSGVEVLGRARGRKIVLTPGLVELGEKMKEVHEKIGRIYAEKGVDLVLLIKSQASGYIISGLESKGFKRYKVYDSTQEAHADLSNVVKSGDTIIFQNDLPDNYF
jgi:UDP-N-acetylmuramoyl-tripeptide--D-alanyl-D-alanine ligase